MAFTVTIDRKFAFPVDDHSIHMVLQGHFENDSNTDVESNGYWQGDEVVLRNPRLFLGREDIDSAAPNPQGATLEFFLNSTYSGCYLGVHDSPLLWDNIPLIGANTTLTPAPITTLPGVFAVQDLAINIKGMTGCSGGARAYLHFALVGELLSTLDNNKGSSGYNNLS